MGTTSAGAAPRDGAARGASPVPPAWLPHVPQRCRSCAQHVGCAQQWDTVRFFFFLFSLLISRSSLFWLVGSFCLFLLSPAFRGRHRTPGLCSVTAPELSIVIYI